MIKKRFGQILLITALLMTIFFICITLEEIYFVSSRIESAYLLLITVFLLIPILFVSKGALKQILVILISIAGFFTLLHIIVSFNKIERIDYRKLKNCNQIIIEDYVANISREWYRVSFGKLYGFNLFYKHTSRQYDIDDSMQKLDDYELPKQYQNVEKKVMIIAEDESMLIDLEKDVAYKITKKSRD